MNYMIDERL